MSLRCSLCLPPPGYGWVVLKGSSREVGRHNGLCMGVVGERRVGDEASGGDELPRERIWSMV